MKLSELNFSFDDLLKLDNSKHKNKEPEEPLLFERNFDNVKPYILERDNKGV